MFFEKPADRFVDRFALNPIGYGDEGPEDLTGVVVRYHLNETTGSAVPDSSGNGRNGTCQNMENGDWVAGKEHLHNCLNFGGTNEYVDCGAIASFERTDTFSIEAWFKTNPVGASCCVVSKFNGGGSNRGWMIWVTTSGLVLFVLAGSLAKRLYVQSPAGPDYGDNAWHRVMITYDGTSDVSGIKMYIDNTDIAFDVNVNVLDITTIDAANMRIGAHATASWMVGMVDELVIHDRVKDFAYDTYRWNGGEGKERLPS